MEEDKDWTAELNDVITKMDGHIKRLRMSVLLGAGSCLIQIADIPAIYYSDSGLGMKLFMIAVSVALASALAGLTWGAATALRHMNNSRNSTAALMSATSLIQAEHHSMQALAAIHALTKS